VFKDDGVGYVINKPKQPLFSEGGDSQPINLDYQARQRQFYDEFVLYADSELGRLYDFLEESGLTQNTWLVFTSDHGEMFERGIFGHRTPVLYQPVIRIPLLILAPGQQQRRDIFDTTSAVDVVPTLLKVTEQGIPDWIEGRVLPPFSGYAAGADRSIYAVEAKFSPDNKPLTNVTTMVVKGRYKLVYYAGYQELGDLKNYSELYDIENDPEELENIDSTHPDVSAELRDELLAKMHEADKPYQNG
jgi:arylsulfatase A-like enzyme